ncbi:MAG: 50S ribosomal protein L20 [Verrucomicrobia bacterium]|nr:50S ribosomal protein L20 [Verrucomicrobiota bacterium]
MPRATNAAASWRRRKRIIKASKGYRGNRSKLYRYAAPAQDKARYWAYRDRKTKKRNFRYLWNTRINIASRAMGLTYSRFIEGMRKSGVALDRKALAHLAEHEPKAFEQLVAQAKTALSKTAAPVATGGQSGA